MLTPRAAAAAQVRYGYSHIFTTSFSGASAWMIFRMRSCESIEEALFVQMTLGDDRAIESVYVAGQLAHRR